MGVYVQVLIPDDRGRNNRTAWLEIYRDGELRPGDPDGVYTYRYRMHTLPWHRGFGGEGVAHRRGDDVWALISRVLEHAEAHDPQRNDRRQR